nr:hypothetical protein [Tanacetum cinerariifolium]
EDQSAGSDDDLSDEGDSIDSREVVDESDSSKDERKTFEEQADLQHAIEPQNHRLMDLQVLDVKRKHPDSGNISEAPGFTSVVSKTPVIFSGFLTWYIISMFKEMTDSSYRTLLCKTKMSGLKDTYPDDIVAPVIKTMAQTQDCILSMGITIKNVAHRIGVTRHQTAEAAAATAYGKSKDKIIPIKGRRGFLDSGDKKKKKDSDGVKKYTIDEAANVGNAVKVKFIDEKLRKPIRGALITMDVPAMGSIKGRDSHLKKVHTYVGGPPTKSILKKTDYEKGEARNGGKNTPTKVRFGPITTSTVAIPADAEGSSNGGTCEARTDCSFSSLVRPKESSTKVHFRALVNDEKLESFDCVLPKAAASKVKSRYENFIVGFFLGKDSSFPVVKQYALNTWRKFGFEKITRNDDGVYLFKFASKSGMDQVLEKGPWLIRKSPIILNKWTPSVSLKKGKVANVPVWVKMYNVPGRISFARALFEVRASSALKKEIIMAVSEDEGDCYVKEVIRIEYEWKPPHCVDCQSF